MALCSEALMSIGKWCDVHKGFVYLICFLYIYSQLFVPCIVITLITC